MKEFISSNGIDMVECELYNWKKIPQYYGKPEPFAYVMDIGTWGLMYQALWNPETEILSMCNTSLDSERAEDVLKFYCATLWDAEIIVHAFIKANKFDMKDTIYELKR